MKTATVTVVVCSLLMACSQPSAPTPLPSARSVVSVTVDGTPRSFILRFPKAYDGKAKLPMVMLLHGATDSAEYAEQAYHVDTKAEAEGYVLVIPDALGSSHAWSSYGESDATKDAKQPAAEPTWGRRANKPIQVADDMASILKALGMAKDTLEKSEKVGYVETPTASLPFVEY